jgi:D-alanyl-lipoteichoic acid acyltransferase DltB (MBOAT superfamily)
MAFTSYDFLLFFLIVFILYWVIRERRWQNLLLLAASYYFYGWVQAWYAVMLGASTLADFFLARGMASMPDRKRLFMGLSLVVNVGVLAFFKYFNFFKDDVVSLLNGVGFQVDPLLITILLPAGLSFFTLKKLGYMIDVSRGTLKPTHTFIDFALYVSFFPQIVAGPIERPQKLLPQIELLRIWKMEFFYEAWPLLVTGVLKKIVIADSVQVLVGRVFSSNDPSGILLLSGTLGFTLQVLADFSAYTDISRGIALLLGFTTSENFKQPYLSISPADFWNRWHISLSTWLRDYIFLPIHRSLLRSRFKSNRLIVTFIPPLMTMLISGVWHGAHSNFIIWGAYWGVLIILYQSVGIRSDWKIASKIKLLLAWLVMFSLIVISWTIFRAPSTAWLIHALDISLLPIPRNEFIFSLIILTTVFAYSIPMVIHHLIDRYAQGSWYQAIFLAAAVALSIMYSNSASADFIYFQF